LPTAFHALQALAIALGIGARLRQIGFKLAYSAVLLFALLEQRTLGSITRQDQLA
jgi:hypothetical protein